MIKVLNADVCRPITKDEQVSAILLADKQDYITSGFTEIQYNKSLNFEFQLL